MMDFSTLFSILAWVLKLYALVLAARVLLDFVQADTSNPLGQGILKITTPALAFFEQFFPKKSNISLAGMIAILLASFIILLLKSPGDFFLPLISSPIEALQLFLGAFLYILVIQIALSFISREDAAMPMLESITKPALAPLRKALPPMAGSFDLAPWVLMILIVIARMIIAYVL